MPLDATVLAALLQSCAANVAPATMTAIIQVESEGDPYRIGVNSGGSLQRQPANGADATATARSLLRKGANFDAGLMQINSANFARLGVTAETVFDPCTNLRAGAALLADNYSRARVAGHADPLRAALSEYNTGSRAKGLFNGYVRKVYAAATGRTPALRPAVVQLSYGSVSPNTVGNLLLSAFGGRITDTLRPINATYGAVHSYHKVGRAVDFVPRGGVGAITRDQIRAVMAANGVRIVELLGPGDPKHSDHWHVAWGTDTGAPLEPPSYSQAPWAVATYQPQQAVAGAYQVSASLNSETRDGEEGASPPPAWDVFAQASWRQRQSSGSVEGGL